MNINALKSELKKDAYSNLTDEAALAALPSPTQELGRIQGDNKLDLVTLIVREGISERLEGVIATGGEQEKGLAKKLNTALNINLLMSDAYRINLGVEDVRNMFEAAKQLELLTDEESKFIEALATYTKYSEFEGVSLEDVKCARFVPAEVISEKLERNGRRVNVEIETLNDIEDMILIYVAESKDGQNWTQYQKVMYQHVNKPGIYNQFFIKPSLKFVKFKAIGTYTDVKITAEAI